jgi:hypothetical protein
MRAPAAAAWSHSTADPMFTSDTRFLTNASVKLGFVPRTATTNELVRGEAAT